MTETTTQSQTFSGLERIYKILTIFILVFGFLFGLFFFDKLLYPSLFFSLLILGGIFVLIFYLGIAPLLLEEQRIKGKIVFDIIFFSFLQIFSSFSFFALFYFLPIVISGVVLKKRFSIIVFLGSFLGFFVSQYFIYLKSSELPRFDNLVFIFLTLIFLGILSFFLKKELPLEKSDEESGFVIKAMAQRRLEFIRRLGVVMEIPAWIIFFICGFIYFFTTSNVGEKLDFMALWFLSGIYTIGFHRLIYPFVIERTKELVFKIDGILFVTICLILFQMVGGITSPLGVLFLVMIFGGAALLGPEFSFIVLVEGFILFFLYGYFFNPSQYHFFLNNPPLGLLIIVIFILAAFLAYIFSSRYWSIFREKERSLKLVNQLVADKGKVEAILESMGDGVFVTDAKKKLILINKSAQHLAKIGRKKVLGRFYGDIFRFFTEDEMPLDYELDCPVQWAISERRSVVRDDLLLITNDHKKINISLYAAPVIDASENIVGGIVVLRDVTREKEIERMKFEFISIASHELKTPIAMIAGHLSMALEEKFGKMDKKVKELVDKAYEGTNRLRKLINDLLNVSRIEEGKMTLSLEKTNLGELILDVIKEFQERAKEKNITLGFQKLSSKLPVLEIDKIKIREVISNLISNALKFTEKGEVKINAKSVNKFLEVRVEDTGVGIEKKDIPYLFQKFHQIENPYTRKEQGTGLGLYICKSIIEMHGGKIWVESKGLGKGSSFIFILPLKK